VEVEIEAGRAEYWPSEQCAVVTVIHNFPRKKVLRIWLATGDGKALDRAMSATDEIARNLGCDRVEIEGRKGWAKRLAHHGYRMERVVLTKDV